MKKSERLAPVVPNGREGVTRKCLLDSVVELESSETLIVEIKGQEGDAKLKAAAAERWCRAVTNDGRFGRWSYHLCFGKKALEKVLEGKKVKETDLAGTERR